MLLYSHNSCNYGRLKSLIMHRNMINSARCFGDLFILIQFVIIFFDPGEVLSIIRLLIGNVGLFYICK